MTLHPLGKLKELIESVGMGISYAYDDLVFLEHNAFIMQFGDDHNTILIHTNYQADQNQVGEGIGKLKMAASSTDLNFILGSSYTLTQADGKNISIEFHE
ncbi:MAG: hypothetical protein AMK70_06050 [Nitrospira bacterium SG8_35_1]|nr:MAG: hypothetical protein AMK70_06050 [Nitrospira bacterium SG8_35_1]